MVLAAVGSLQFGAALAVTIFDELGPAGTALARLALAAVVLLAIWRPRVRGQARGDLRLAAAFGVVLGLMNLCIYEAIDRIPLGVAVTIEFAGPLAVAVAGSRRALDLLWAGLAGAGVLVLGGGVEGGDALGVVFALLAAACWAAYILLGARVSRAFPGGRGLAMAMAVGALVVAPFGLAGGGADLVDPELLGIAAAVAVLSSVIPYSLELEALRRIAARVFGVLMSLEPAVAALAGLVVLDQRLDAAEWLAVGLVVAASAGVTLTGREAAPVRD